MQIAIWFDNTINSPAQPIAELLRRLCPSLKCDVIQHPIRIRQSSLTYKNFIPYFEEAGVTEDAFDASLLFTTVRYENNYFYESTGRRFAISLSDWNQLTDLPLTNGIIYFLVDILIRDILGVGDRHMDRNTGCISDMLIDKRGIDLAMRAAFVCKDCVSGHKFSPEEEKLFGELQNVLNIISAASRAGTDVLAAANALMAKKADTKFDALLCHNNFDKPAVRKINAQLKNAGIVTWFDEEQIKPGRLWQPALEKQIKSISNALVFVGSKGLGPWEEMEVRAFLSEFVNRRCPVIPVILPGTKSVPELPIFLNQLQYVDLRKKAKDGLSRIVHALDRQ